MSTAVALFQSVSQMCRYIAVDSISDYFDSVHSRSSIPCYRGHVVAMCVPVLAQMEDLVDMDAKGIQSHRET